MASASAAILLISSLLLCGTAHAFRSTEAKSYTDPDYKEYIPKRVVLIVQNTSNEMRKEIEHRAQEALHEKGITVIFYRDLFSPTRDWGKADHAAVFAREGIDSSFIISLGVRSEFVSPMAAFGTTNISNAYGTGTASTTTVMINSAKSKAEFSAVLIDIANARTAWYADITISAGGTLFVGANKDARAAVDGLLEELVKEGHLPGAMPPK